MNLSTVEGYNPIGYQEPADKRILYHLFYHKSMVETIERFRWHSLPKELTQDLIERVLYFRNKGTLFMGTDGKYKFLPFTLQGELDVYGRYTDIVPVLFTGKNTDKEYYNSGKPLKVAYEVGEEGEAVILSDSSLEISQDNIPLSVSMRPLIEQMVEILVLINIDLISSAKVYTIVAPDEATKKAIELEFEGLDARVLSGKRVVVVTSKMPLAELAKNDSRDSNRYFQVYQSFENLRKDILGIPNSGTFMKMSIQTDDEVASNSQASSVLENALRQRKEFCEIVNAVFGLNISVELNEVKENNIIGTSSNNSDRNDGTIKEDE